MYRTGSFLDISLEGKLTNAVLVGGLSLAG